MKFKDLGISTKTLLSLESLGFDEPTEVQEKVIPLILKGNEVMARSQTGTGKTAAYGIGLIELITNGKMKKGLILAPTRELAIQIGKDLRAIADTHRLRINVIYGGESITKQLHFLSRGYDIIIATPGRLLDHHRRGSIELFQFNLIVLDEADRMLDMGFREDIEEILSEVNETRKTFLFSATLTNEIKSIAHNYMNDPILIELGTMEKEGQIEEQTVEVTKEGKFNALREILHSQPDSKILIFVDTQRYAEKLTENLRQSRIKVQFLHGGLRQSKREQIVRDFKEGYFKILIATDVASRGLHIDDISHVINYDQPRDRETHIHRVGRTGRMGQKGNAITFVEKGSGARTIRVGGRRNPAGGRKVFGRGNRDSRSGRNSKDNRRGRDSRGGGRGSSSHTQRSERGFNY